MQEAQALVGVGIQRPVVGVIAVSGYQNIRRAPDRAADSHHHRRMGVVLAVKGDLYRVPWLHPGDVRLHRHGPRDRPLRGIKVVPARLPNLPLRTNYLC